MTYSGPSRTRIKFCGFTRAQDIELAVSLGVDAVGLVCVPGSKRELSAAQASALRQQVPPMVSVVLLLANASEADARAAISQVRPDLVQFHGNESPEFCDALGQPYLRAVPVQAAGDVQTAAAKYPSARGLLLDAHVPGGMGGTGARFDWSFIPAKAAPPLILAGGLDPDNVGEAVRMSALYGVDVSSGIESGPGLKDAGRMRAFIDAVRQADDFRSK